VAIGGDSGVGMGVQSKEDVGVQGEGGGGRAGQVEGAQVEEVQFEEGMDAGEVGILRAVA